MFAFNTADPQDFAHACNTIRQPYHILRCGERWESTSLQPDRTRQAGD
jgi:hypothetical protein